MRLSHLCLLTAVCLTAATAYGQYALLPENDYAWGFRDRVDLPLVGAGGLNRPILSLVDLTGDGVPELYAFDRDGDVHVAFRQSARGANDWTPALELVADWPPVQQYALLRDANGDGAPEMFTYRNAATRSGIEVYEGRLTGSTTAFTKVEFPAFDFDILHFERSGSRFSFIYCEDQDVPLIEDIDGDGDLDIISFDVVGSYMEHYENIGSTGGSVRSALRYRRATTCYGGAYESSFDGTVQLSGVAGTCATPFQDPGGLQARHGLHAGSTVAAHDTDGDGDLDLLVGDVASPALVELNNSPEGGTAFFTDVDYGWPSTSTPVDVNLFPAAFPLATGPGGSTEVYVTPQGRSASDDIDVVWRYGTDDETGGVSLLTRSFLTDEMLDVGTGSMFAMGDLSGDGVDDILVGVNSSRTDLVQRASFRYFEFDAGRYVRRAPTWLNTVNAVAGTTLGLAPALADMDGDGDLDLLFGSNEGYVSYAENEGGANSPARFNRVDAQWMGIQVGEQSAPTVGDLSGDGLPDLLIGQRSGLLNYFVNVGSETNAEFSSTPTAPQYARIDVREIGEPFSNVKPTLTEIDGEQVLYVGSLRGNLNVYTDLPSDPEERATPALTRQLARGFDIQLAFGRDPNGNVVTLLGNRRGGLHLYRREGAISNAAAPSVPQVSWLLSPNPSVGPATAFGLPAGASVTITAVTGQALGVFALRQNTLPTLAPGVYVVSPVGTDGTPLGEPKRLVVVRSGS